MMDRQAVFEAIKTAHEFAQEKIDIKGCCFGADFVDGTFQGEQGYYLFLAGLVAKLRCQRILELGTYLGGSICAMVRGVGYSGVQSAEIVTVDLTPHRSATFNAIPQVKRVTGDCLNDSVAQLIARSFTGPVDLLFVDPTHTYDCTKGCLEKYIPLVSPRLIILDDISLNDEMARLWKELQAKYGDRAIDVTEDARRGSYRGTACGFGILIES